MPINGPWGSSSGFNRSLECSSGCRRLLELLPQAPGVWGSHKFRGGAHLYLSGAVQPTLPVVAEQVTELAEQSDPRREGPEGRAGPPPTATPRMGTAWCSSGCDHVCFSFFTWESEKKVRGLALPLTGSGTRVMPDDFLEPPNSCKPANPGGGC